jgi:hypothetical protein
MCDRDAVASPLDQSAAPTVRARKDVARRFRRHAWLPLLLVLVCATAYGLFFVVPYYVNDLDRFPLQEVAGGAHDPSALWPYRDGGVLSAVWGYGALFMFMFGFFIAFGAPLWAAIVLWRDRRVLRVRERCALAMALLGGAALLTGLGSPFGTSLIAWYLD